MTNPPVTRDYAASRYGQLHYHIAIPATAPTTPPLLCLHQTPGNGRDWLPVIPECLVMLASIQPQQVVHVGSFSQ